MQKSSTRILISIIIGLLIALTYLTWNLYRQTHSSPVSGFSYAKAVENAAPSVVSIYSQSSEVDDKGLWNNPLFSGYGERLKKPEQSAPRLGSGVIIDKSGHILTNYHVVRMTDKIRVSLASGKTSPATIVAEDPDSDLAIIQIPADLIADTEASTSPGMGRPIKTSGAQPKPGDVVLAIGNAYGVGQAVTQGIVSGLGRSNLGLANIENYIQTDVAINPGSSGGALVNPNGELIGIVTAVFSTDGTYQGISFAIPAEVALRIAGELIRSGKVIRGYLGVEMHALTPYEADFFGLGNTNGMLVTGIHDGSPAEEAGLKPGDVLLKINGKVVASATQGQQAVAMTRPGTSISLTVFRRGALLEVKPIAASRPEEH
ncbi:serine protease [Hahella sp. CCB-MM4]|uniref:S1C family serine protease n=1 Tax=Hahella sp. (strain CCB-MM4) TaxID=1926491 RepID=UPI000BD02E87|nr:trypsin-like peptidase domain-containing protein [Hahella sp. CCB-MM4]OZG70528.1 serine protease [Hahella sp. CCB-MM4]